MSTKIYVYDKKPFSTLTIVLTADISESSAGLIMVLRCSDFEHCSKLRHLVNGSCNSLRKAVGTTVEFFSTVVGTIELIKQEAQLSQRGRSCLVLLSILVSR